MNQTDYRRRWIEKHPQQYRAKYLIRNYKNEDKKYNRETPDFNSKWMVENILSKPCVYCGAKGWDIIGCDRVDNTIGHIKSNVVPSCLHCNMVKPKEDNWKSKYSEKAKKVQVIAYKKDGTYVGEYPSIREASIQLNCNETNIGQVIRGEKKTHKGYIFTKKKGRNPRELSSFLGFNFFYGIAWILLA